MHLCAQRGSHVSRLICLPTSKPHPQRPQSMAIMVSCFFGHHSHPDLTPVSKQHLFSVTANLLLSHSPVMLMRGTTVCANPVMAHHVLVDIPVSVLSRKGSTTRHVNKREVPDHAVWIRLMASKNSKLRHELSIQTSFPFIQPKTLSLYSFRSRTYPYKVS